MSKVVFVPILETNSDVQNRIRELRNMENVRKYMYTDHIISEEEHQRWLASLENNDRQLVMVVMFENEVVGLVSLSNINRLHRTADWAFYIHEDLQGKGIGSVVEYMLIEKAFHEKGVIKLNCEVLETNPSVIKLHKKFGFVEEGVRRKNIIKNNERIDVHLLGLLKDEWSEVKPRMQKVVERIVR